MTAGTPSHPLPIEQAAEVLGVRPGTLRRWVAEGCPHVPGRRGRGHAALVDLVQVRAWLGTRNAHDPGLIRSGMAQELAAQLPAVLADAAFAAFVEIDAPAKRQFAGPLTYAWAFMASAVADHLRAQCPDVPEVTFIPEAIERLRKIEHGSSIL